METIANVSYERAKKIKIKIITGKNLSSKKAIPDKNKGNSNNPETRTAPRLLMY